jgi:hypothetical protein
MKVAALITWVITALGGLILLGTWLSRGGLRARETGASRFPLGLIFGHFLLAATGLVLWVVYLSATPTPSPGSRWPSWCSWRRWG